MTLFYAAIKRFNFFLGFPFFVMFFFCVCVWVQSYLFVALSIDTIVFLLISIS